MDLPGHLGRGSVALGLARVDMDGDGLDGLRRMAVVMPTIPMIAIRSVDMGCLRLGGDPPAHAYLRDCLRCRNSLQAQTLHRRLQSSGA